MGVNIRNLPNPLLYNYQYDQLNRLIHMDAWNRTGTGWSAITKVPDFQERVAYDPNGNILKYRRNGNNTFAGKPLAMDSLNYFYTAGTNKLDHIRDSVLPAGANVYNDIQTQSSGNYQYDSIGDLVSDAASGISNITWTVYGKIASITRGGDTTIKYTYDASGNRISKTVVTANNTITTWYVRDAQGNVLSVYTYGDPATSGGDLAQTELHIYGSSRLGIWKTNNNVELTPPVITSTMPLLGLGDSLIFTRGNKLFELTNHLGNVLVTISDKRYGISKDDSTVAYFNPEVVSAQDYYPFGMLEPYRSYTEANVGNYRYGFNGQEKTDEIAGVGNHTTAEFWEYDPRIGRRWNLDPKPTKVVSEYSVLDNSPIRISDPLGDTIIIRYTSRDAHSSEVIYKDGTVSPRTGSVVKLDNVHNYMYNVVKDLNTIRSSKNKEPSKRLKALENSKQIHIIEMTEPDEKNHNSPLSDENDKNGIPTGTTTSYDPEDYTTKTGTVRKPVIGLAHELLGHGYDSDQGKADYSKTKNGIPMYEVNAVRIENIIRAKIGEPKRTTYQETPIPEILLDAPFEKR